VSVPCGFGMGDTLPIGLMLHGRPLAEALLYRVAYAYEQATEWHVRHPAL
jgi:aspartyl-tRNA(Asn)/glutamyl-tRNA(Gln) amidotransferase subunit A